MVITWHGFSCFKIEEKTHSGDVSLVIDPYSPEDGKKLSRVLAADIAVSSHDSPRHNNIEAVGGAPFVIDGPGEYEVKDIFVTGVSTHNASADEKSKEKNTMFYHFFISL